MNLTDFVLIMVKLVCLSVWSNLSELEPATTKTIIIQPLFSPSLTLLHYPLILTVVFQKPVFTKSAFMWCSKWCSYFHIVFFSQVHSKGNHGYTLYDRCISCGAWSRSITCSNAALFGAWSRSTIWAIWYLNSEHHMQHHMTQDLVKCPAKSSLLLITTMNWGLLK